MMLSQCFSQDITLYLLQRELLFTLKVIIEQEDAKKRAIYLF